MSWLSELAEKAGVGRTGGKRFWVNGAGFGKIGGTADLALDEETGMIDVNCRALTAVTRLVLPYMSENSRIQFASAAAFLPQPRGLPCAGHKGVCLKLQPGAGHGVKAAADLRDGSLSGTGQKQSFLILPRPPERFRFISAWSWQTPKRL